MDITQFILLFVLIVLTLFLFILGVQVFLILKDLKTTLEKLNNVISDISQITEKMKDPTSLISSLAKGVKASFSIVDSLNSKKHKGEVLFEIKHEAEEILDKLKDLEDRDNNKNSNPEEDRELSLNTSKPIKDKPTVRRFFKHH